MKTLMALTLTAGLWVACSGPGQDNDRTANSCVPGEEVACTCSSGATAVRQCNAAGDEYSGCLCGGASSSSSSSGSSSSGSSGGASSSSGAAAGTRLLDVTLPGMSGNENSGAANHTGLAALSGNTVAVTGRRTSTTFQGAVIIAIDNPGTPVDVPMPDYPRDVMGSGTGFLVAGTTPGLRQVTAQGAATLLFEQAHVFGQFRALGSNKLAAVTDGAVDILDGFTVDSLSTPGYAVLSPATPDGIVWQATRNGDTISVDPVDSSATGAFTTVKPEDFDARVAALSVDGQGHALLLYDNYHTNGTRHYLRIYNNGALQGANSYTSLEGAVVVGGGSQDVVTAEFVAEQLIIKRMRPDLLTTVWMDTMVTDQGYVVLHSLARASDGRVVVVGSVASSNRSFLVRVYAP